MKITIDLPVLILIFVGVSIIYFFGYRSGVQQGEENERQRSVRESGGYFIVADEKGDISFIEGHGLFIGRKEGSK